MSVRYLPHDPHVSIEEPGLFERKVFPLLAGALTMLFGWGVGHFYAGRTKTALWLTAAQIGFSLLFLEYAHYDLTHRIGLVSVRSGAVFIPLQNLPFAVWAAFAAEERPIAPAFEPWRAPAYLALLLTPWLLTLVFGWATGLWSFFLSYASFAS